MLCDEPSQANRRCPPFAIEMETGSGKTCIYQRTIRELSRRYGYAIVKHDASTVYMVR